MFIVLVQDDGEGGGERTRSAALGGGGSGASVLLASLKYACHSLKSQKERSSKPRVIMRTTAPHPRRRGRWAAPPHPAPRKQAGSTISATAKREASRSVVHQAGSLAQEPAERNGADTRINTHSPTCTARSTGTAGSTVPRSDATPGREPSQPCSCRRPGGSLKVHSWCDIITARTAQQQHRCRLTVTLITHRISARMHAPCPLVWPLHKCVFETAWCGFGIFRC